MKMHAWLWLIVGKDIRRPSFQIHNQVYNAKLYVIMQQPCASYTLNGPFLRHFIVFVLSSFAGNYIVCEHKDAYER